MILEDNIKDFYIDDDKEKRIWKECVFIFDTSALLKFYFFSRDLQNKVFDNIFENIKDRLWIPGHVEYEYLKNRKNTLKKPIEEKYKKLEKEDIRPINEGIKDILNKVKNLKQVTQKSDSHPYVDNELTENFLLLTEEFQNSFIEFEKKMKEEIKKREEEINALQEDDIVLKKISNFFVVGRQYSFKKMICIAKEGELRYSLEIPPGYKDAKGSNRKEGLQKFGDLFIWKQIIEYAKEIKKPVAFIVDDVKEDWCYKIRRGSEDRIERPREELVKEIRDESNVDFWMYTFSQFLFTCKKILKLNVTDEVIEEVKNIAITDDGLDDLMLRLDNNDPEVRSELIERNLGLVFKIANKYKSTGCDIDDLISVGTIGLIKAVNTFNPHQMKELISYINICIENEILMYLRKNSKLTYEFSINETIGYDIENNEISLQDVIALPEDEFTELYQHFDNELIRQSLNKLTDREKRIIDLRFGLSSEKTKTQKEVAEILGISTTYVSRLEKEVLNKLRKEIS